MPKPIPCRPLWWRTLRGILLAPLFVVGVIVFFGFGSVLLLTGGGK